MKKLMIAMAIAGAVGFAQADLNTTNADFELANLGMFSIGSGEGTEWAAAPEDMDGGYVTTAIVTNDTPAAEVGGSQYLKLDGVTELARNANSEDYTQPYEIGSGKVYIDTLVKFTITEDDAPVPGDGDKLCIWVKENGGTTNLMVTAGYVDAQMNTTPTNYITSYTFDGDLNNTWYRLIVEVIPGIDQSGIFQGFKISVGEAGSSLTLVTSSESKYACSDSPLTETESEIFPSLFDITSRGEATTTQISSVAFKGTGAIDNLQFTTENPVPVVIPTYTLTIPSVTNENGVAIATAAVTTNSVTVSDLTAIPSNTEVTVTWTVVDATAYEITAGGTETFTMVGNKTAAEPTVTPKSTPSGWKTPEQAAEIADNTPAVDVYPSLSGSALATADAKKLTKWATDNSINFNDVKDDTTGTYTEAYLLNCTLAEVETEKDEFVLTITVASDGTPTVNLPDGKTYNGKVQMKGSNDLSTWNDVNAASTTYHFYKYELSL